TPRGPAPEPPDRAERLRRLAVADDEQLGVTQTDAGAGHVVLGDSRLAHDRHAAAGSEHPAELAQCVRADQDVVGRIDPDGDAPHRGYTSSTASTTCETVRPSVSTSASAAASYAAARTTASRSRGAVPRPPRRGRSVPSLTRAMSVAVSAWSHTTNPVRCRRRRLSPSSTAPPPHAMTAGVGVAHASSTARRSSCRKL